MERYKADCKTVFDLSRFDPVFPMVNGGPAMTSFGSPGLIDTINPADGQRHILQTAISSAPPIHTYDAHSWHSHVSTHHPAADRLRTPSLRRMGWRAASRKESRTSHGYRHNCRADVRCTKEQSGTMHTPAQTCPSRREA